MKLANTRVIRSLLLAGLALALGACASMRFTSAWRDTSYQGPPLKKIVVIGVSDQVASRRVFEDEFAKALKAAGVDAIPGYSLLPDKPDRSREELQQAVSTVQADGILVTRTLRTERRTDYSPGYVTYGPAFGYNSFWGYYGAMGMGVYAEPGRIYSYDVVTVETNLWPARDGKVLWSALSQTTDPGNTLTVTQELSKLVIDALREGQLIAAPPPK
ncbi:hypothetical protein [Niveibacterium sp. SC-1]|uniref:hypothetical protein n=1 Tax=Niveibacterium sp. SC-1 TaxID=3135646 RepID=UPI00311D9A40